MTFSLPPSYRTGRQLWLRLRRRRYEVDERFAANIDGHAEGLTLFLSAAIRANARR